MPSPIFKLSLGTADMSATSTTGWCLIDGCSIVSIFTEWPGSGNPTGVFTLQATNEPWPIGASDSNIDIYDLGATFAAIPSGSASSGDDQFSNVAGKWVRVKYTRSSGGGGTTAFNGSLVAKQA